MPINVAGPESGIVQHPHQRLKLNPAHTPLPLNLLLNHGIYPRCAVGGTVGSLVQLFAGFVRQQDEVLDRHAGQLELGLAGENSVAHIEKGLLNGCAAADSTVIVQQQHLNKNNKSFIVSKNINKKVEY